MDARDMSAFESESFGSVIDKGVLTIHWLFFLILYYYSFN